MSSRFPSSEINHNRESVEDADVQFAAKVLYGILGPREGAAGLQAPNGGTPIAVLSIGEQHRQANLAPSSGMTNLRPIRARSASFPPNSAPHSPRRARRGSSRSEPNPPNSALRPPQRARRRSSRSRSPTDDASSGQQQDQNRGNQASRTRSDFARASKAWCRKLKTIDIALLPQEFPPKNKLEGPLPERRSSDRNYDPAVGAGAADINLDDVLSAQEQRMFRSLGFSREEYIACKTRIFACYAWRTLEDGHHFNIESAQAVCPKDVNRIVPLFHWYLSMGHFNEVGLQYQPVVADRPGSIGRLRAQRPYLDSALASTL